MLANMTEAGQPAIQIDHYCGFQLFPSRSIFESVHLHVHGAETYSIELGELALGNISRLENLVAKIPAISSKAEKMPCSSLQPRIRRSANRLKRIRNCNSSGVARQSPKSTPCWNLKSCRTMALWMMLREI